MNVVVLKGVLSKAPDYRSLPSGSEVVSYEITTRYDDGRADSVPVTWFDRPAGAPEFAEGDEVVVAGRVKRRFFRSGGVTQSRTEVVADAVVASRPAKRARGLVTATLRRVQ